MKMSAELVRRELREAVLLIDLESGAEVRGRVGRCEVEQALPVLRQVRAEVDDLGQLRAVELRDARDHHAAHAVADEDDWLGSGVDGRAHLGNVGVQRRLRQRRLVASVSWQLDRGDGCAVGAQAGRHVVPAPGAHPGAVHEDVALLRGDVRVAAAPDERRERGRENERDQFDVFSV